MRPVMNKIYNLAFPKEEKFRFYAGIIFLLLGMYPSINYGFNPMTSLFLLTGVLLLITRFLAIRQMYKAHDLLYFIIIIILLGVSLYTAKGIELITDLIEIMFLVCLGIYVIISRKRETRSKQSEVKS